jgi:hypothetical protein
VTGPFDRELRSLRSSNRPSYTKSSHDPDGGKLESTLTAAKGAGYEVKHHVDTDTATEVKLHHPGLGHTVRAYRNKTSQKLNVSHSEDYAQSANRARPVKESKYELTPEKEHQMHENAMKLVDAVVAGKGADATQLFQDMVGDKSYELLQGVRDELSKSAFDFTAVTEDETPPEDPEDDDEGDESEDETGDEE